MYTVHLTEGHCLSEWTESDIKIIFHDVNHIMMLHFVPTGFIAILVLMSVSILTTGDNILYLDTLNKPDIGSSCMRIPVFISKG